MPKYTEIFAEHMTECDLNYWRLRKLLPALEGADRREFELDQARRRVRIQVTERSPYTTTVQVAQAEARCPWTDAPQLTVRLYHDAQMAEVVAFNDQRHFQPRYTYPNPRMRHGDEKVQINRFLGEWLRHCLERGQALEPLPVK